jgi:hypothetical protein
MMRPSVPPRPPIGGALLALLFLLAAHAAAAAELVIDGGFEAIQKSSELRKDSDGQDWYESRKSKQGRKLLMLSTKKIYGNKTHKAMIKADPEENTYLSQRLPEALTGTFTAKYDVAVKLIRPEYDRSGFFFLGVSTDKKRGPNSTGTERFVMIGFANTGREGKIDLVAYEGKDDWDEQTVLVEDLDIKTWYTVTVRVDVPGQTYTVQVGDGAESQPLQAFRTKKQGPPAEITHLSFASWNDGAGTFYVDNVSVVED